MSPSTESNADPHSASRHNLTLEHRGHQASAIGSVIPVKLKALKVDGDECQRYSRAMGFNIQRRAFLHFLVLWGAIFCLSPEALGLVPTVDCTPKTGTAYVSGVPETIDLVTFEGKLVSAKIVDPLYVMVMAAHADGVDLKLSSGFRTYEQQQYLYNCYKNCNCNDCNVAAPPGYSNHQSGHAVDITTGCKLGWSNDYCASQSTTFAWLIKNAGYYGFEKTVKSEPWHWEWWEGGPGGGICFDSCEAGCTPPSENEVDPMQKVNEGWIGGPCKTHAECGSPDGFCFDQAQDFAYGMCSEPCEKYCPDTPGAVVTFCVNTQELGMEPSEGTCVAKCDDAQSPGGCRPGYLCKVLPRFNDPATQASVCVPSEGGNQAISPKGWSVGISATTCSFSRCALEFGKVCSESTPNGPSCVNALCLDSATQDLVTGGHCSYLYSEHGTAVTCADNGEVLDQTTCSNEAPCNPCGSCGSVPEEVCDGIDNDCDGDIDEGVLNACGECGDVPSEECDGQDNDCDGDIDEGCAPVQGDEGSPDEGSSDEGSSDALYAPENAEPISRQGETTVGVIQNGSDAASGCNSSGGLIRPWFFFSQNQGQ